MPTTLCLHSACRLFRITFLDNGYFLIAKTMERSQFDLDMYQYQLLAAAAGYNLIFKNRINDGGF